MAALSPLSPLSPRAHLAPLNDPASPSPRLPDESEFYEGPRVQGLPETGPGEVGRIATRGHVAYEGGFKAGVPHGHGQRYYDGGEKGGDSYTGEWAGGKRHGYGSYDYANGAFYRGGFDAGDRSGAGSTTYPDDRVAISRFEKDAPVGEGATWVPDGSGGFECYRLRDGRVEGTLAPDVAADLALALRVDVPAGARGYRGARDASGRPHGAEGTLCREKSTYTGAWERGKAHGPGTTTYADGKALVALYDAGSATGRGVCFAPDGDEAYACDGAVAGDRVSLREAAALAEEIGRPKPDNLVVYEGDVDDRGFWTGDGAITYADGRRYVGGFFEGERSGAGVELFTDGANYEGGFQANAPHGAGTQTAADGSTFSGAFAHGRPVGAFTQIAADGTAEVNSSDGGGESDWEGARWTPDRTAAARVLSTRLARSEEPCTLQEAADIAAKLGRPVPEPAP